MAQFGMNLEEYFPESVAAFEPQAAVEDLEQLVGAAGDADPFNPAAAAAAEAPPEVPMFQLVQVDYKPNHLLHMVVASGIVVMALANNHIIRLNLQQPQDIEDIEVTRRSDDHIHRVFLDPTGNHLLVTTRAEENFYMHASFKKPRPLPKLRGVVIESVAWDMQNTREAGVATTKSFLVGTTTGKIFECCFENVAERRLADLVGVGNKDHVWKLVYTLEGGQPVTGLRFERFPPTADQQVKFFVMATTATRLYQFIGGPTFEACFSYYEQMPSFQEIPPGVNKRSELAFFSRPGGSAQSFAWLTGPGVYHGKLVYGMQLPGDTISQDCKFLPYPTPDDPPLSILFTEFHYLLLHEHKFQCINALSEEPVFEFELHSRVGAVRGLAHDQLSGTIWVFCEHAVFEVVVTAEDRDVWRLYMKRGEWSIATEYCKGDRRKKNEVWMAQAMAYFADSKYELAASYFAKTHVPFEEVALMFINKDKRDALKSYLLQKLETVPRDAIIQVTVIATWLVEIFLNKLNLLSDACNQLKRPSAAASAAAAAAASMASASATFPSLEAAQTQYEMVESEFHNFLAQYRDKLYPATTFNLISSHGRVSDMLFFAELICDYERIVAHYIRSRDYRQAIDTLARLPASQELLFYKFSPDLMTAMPEATVDCWMAVNFLQPKRLFPALMRYEETRPQKLDGPNQAVRYLQHVVGLGNTEPAIHNYLLSLLAQRAHDSGSTGGSAATADDAALLAFIDGSGQGTIHYDPKYALRLCTKLAKPQACVMIYGKMGLFEEAVDLALSVDIELAKANANKPEDEAVRKRLWLKIAQHVVRETSDIREAMQFLASCELLKVEDILPFFSEFTRIDDFKDQICASLEEYNAHIGALREEMNDATRAAEAVRQDINELRAKCGVVRAGQPCEVCHRAVLTRSFLLFPCRHAFHGDCLLSFATPLLPPVRRARVLELTARLNAPSASSRGARSAKAQSQDTEAARSEIDSIVAAECPLCGELMIDQITAPFVTPGDPAIAVWALPHRD